MIDVQIKIVPGEYVANLGTVDTGQGYLKLEIMPAILPDALRSTAVTMLRIIEAHS